MAGLPVKNIADVFDNIAGKSSWGGAWNSGSCLSNKGLIH